jgi:V/A-type H+/Na+-transporting ATPase subunit F
MRAAVMGEKNMVLAFKDLGIDVFAIEDEEDLEKAKKEIEHGFAVLFVTQTLADKYNLEDLYAKTLPAVLLIPGVRKSEGNGSASLKKILERALGSELNI